MGYVAAKDLESAPSAASSVAIAGNDQRARRRMASALAKRPEFVVGACASAPRLVRSPARFELVAFHCKTIDAEELAFVAELRGKSPDLRIVAVCESANSRTARRAVDAGVDGLVLAQRLEHALAPTIIAVLAGQTAVPQELRASARKPSLSFREKQILGMVVLGFTNGEIGGRLFLAESTVKSHLSSAFGKLGVRSRHEAAAMILDPHGSLGAGILAITDGDGDNRAA